MKKLFAISALALVACQDPIHKVFPNPKEEKSCEILSSAMETACREYPEEEFEGYKGGCRMVASCGKMKTCTCGHEEPK